MVDGRVHRMTELFGRLAPGADLDAARAELRTAHSAIVKEHYESYPSNADFRIDAVRLRDQIVAPARTILLVLLAASALAGQGLRQQAQAQQVPAPTLRAGQKPNIVVIMGDDIGWFNLGCYHRGMMSGKTPNLDRLAQQGMLFTDYYAEASCTAGRAAFITGEIPMRTGLTTVGQAGADVGMPAQACTIAS